jgi:hypothetical protein
MFNYSCYDVLALAADVMEVVFLNDVVDKPS